MRAAHLLCPAALLAPPARLASPARQPAGEKENSPRADCTIARTTVTHTQLDDGRPKRVRVTLERSRFERAGAQSAMRLMVYVSDLYDNSSHSQVRAP